MSKPGKVGRAWGVWVIVGGVWDVQSELGKVGSVWGMYEGADCREVGGVWGL